MTVRELISKLIKMDMDIEVVDDDGSPIDQVRLTVDHDEENDVVQII